jgi:hypothetical protein
MLWPPPPAIVTCAVPGPCDVTVNWPGVPPAAIVAIAPLSVEGVNAPA